MCCSFQLECVECKGRKESQKVGECLVLIHMSMIPKSACSSSSIEKSS